MGHCLRIVGLVQIAALAVACNVAGSFTVQQMLAVPPEAGETRRYSKPPERIEVAVREAVRDLAFEVVDRRRLDDGTLLVLGTKGEQSGGSWVRVQVLRSVQDSTDVRVYSQRYDPLDITAVGNWRPHVFRFLDAALEEHGAIVGDYVPSRVDPPQRPM